jgi:hypothetical protein
VVGFVFFVVDLPSCGIIFVERSDKMFSMLAVSTSWNFLFCIIVSVVFLFTLDPENGSCNMNDYVTGTQFCTLLLVPFVAWSFVSNGTLARYRVSALSCWFKITQQPENTMGEGLIGPFRNNCEENSMVSQVFNLFFDRWIVVALVDVLFVFLARYGVVGNSGDTNSDLVSTFFQVWASSMVFNDTLDLFRGRHPEIANKWTLTFIPQVIMIWISGIMSFILVFIMGFGADSTPGGRGFITFTLAVRFLIHVYELVAFTNLISVINKFENDLLEAVVTSSSMHQPAESGIDYPFRSNSESSYQRRSATAHASLSNVSGGDADIPDHEKTNVLSITSSMPESVVLKGPRSDYSQVYKECDKIADVLKMLVTLIFINTVFDVAAFVSSVTVSFTGNIIVTQTLKLTMFLLPWVYLAAYRWASLNCAVSFARKTSVVFLVTTAYVITTIIGGYLGCAFLRGEDFSGNSGKQFLLYIAKTSALPTTVSIAFAALSSPGVRGWQRLPWYAGYFMVPMIWMPPFVMQELHEASGANFLSMGLLHACAWIIMVGVGMFNLGQLGVWFATVTGILMLIFGVKLLWPPGRSIPFVTPDSSQLYKRFDAFLRDSKYGSYHIYFALTTMFLFIVHGIIKINFSYSWYFLFLIFAMLIMIVSHPVKRYFSHRVLHAAVGSQRDRYEILSKTTTQLRGKGLVKVELVLSLPSNVDLTTLQGCGDVIVIQNLALEKGYESLGNFYRSIETAHYFSVVSIDLLPNPDSADLLPTARVTLMIQKTNRLDGASTSLVEDADSAKVKHQVRVLGFLKSNSLEALYSPCLIAFGYESGSAAFCSMMKERMRMRLVVETSAKRVKISELTDLCIIWCQFMRKPRGRDVNASDIASALKELSAMQEFLYSNSGGRGVKMLFVCTGVPLEWTPDPESISHRTVMLETEVATTLGCTFSSYDRTNTTNDLPRPSWFSPPLSMVSGEYNPNNPNHANNPAIQGSQGRLSSVNGVFRGSILNFADTWGRASSVESEELRAAANAANTGRKSSHNRTSLAKRFSFGGLKVIKEEDSKSESKASDGVELNKDDTSATRDRVASPTFTPFTHADSNNNTNGHHKTSDTVAENTTANGNVNGNGKTLRKVTSKPDIESGLPLTQEQLYMQQQQLVQSQQGNGNETYSPPPHAPIDKRDEYRRDVRRSSLFSVPHHFTAQLNTRHRSPVETLVNIQTKEESWIPLRHALGSNWKTFCNTLDYRVGSAVHWLNHPGGPDYTSLFITEHQSDVPILRDFKYSEVYDGKWNSVFVKAIFHNLSDVVEVNTNIIEHQLRYCKNPAHYIAGQMGNDRDPVESAPLACSVLYSGDYATAKRENLRCTVDRIQERENKKEQPATLYFIPDA